MINFFPIASLLTLGIIFLYGFIREYHNNDKNASAALIRISAFNTTFAFSLISFSVLVSAISLYWLSHPLELYYLFIGFFLAIALCFVFHFNKFDKPSFFLCLLANILFIVFSFYLMTMFYDGSFDGMTYHQTAIYYLKNGWIPDKEKLFFRWCNEYPKGPWIWGALSYKLSGNIQAGKNINIIAIYSLFNTALYFSLRLNNKIFISCIVATIGILNPVVITQLFTFYTDGLLYNFFISIVLLVSLLFRSSPRNKIFLTCILLLIIPFAANIKFTGMVYSYLLLGLACAFAIVKKQRTSFLTIVRITILSLVLSICFFGYNPYLSNVMNGKHIFHPLFGSRKVDIMTMNRPKYMNENNPLYNFAASILSKVSNNKFLQKPELRNPFQLEVFTETKLIDLETRTNGFGPYFVLSLILSITALVYYACKKWPENQDKIPLVFILLSIIFATVLNKEAWWARYVPHLWFLTALVLVIPSLSRVSKLTKTIVIVLGLTTSIPTIYYTIKRNYEGTVILKQGINLLQREQNNLVVFSQMRIFETSLKALLEDNDILFSYATLGDNLRPLILYKERGNKKVVICKKVN